MSDTPFDAIVLGAGVSGLVAAHILLTGDARRVAILDRYDRLGGNHIDVAIGGMTFDIGSFIFQDDSPLLRHFPELMPQYVPIDYAVSRIAPDRRVLAYPYSVKDEFVRAGPVEWLRAGWSVAKARLTTRNIRNAEDYARYWIGERTLMRSGLHKYMERFYGVPANRIDAQFAAKRMRWLEERASVVNVMRGKLKRRAAAAVPNQQVARPKSGFAALYAPARDKLESLGATFDLGVDLRAIEKTPDSQMRVRTGDGGSVVAPRVISTIPLQDSMSLCGLAPPVGLQSVKLISLFFSFDGERGFDTCVLYNFDLTGCWKRLTVFSDFYGRVDGREYFTAEVNAEGVGDSVETAVADFIADAKRKNLFRGTLRFEGSHALDNAYPVYLDGTSDAAEAAIKQLAAAGVESFGRQGGFDYLPTARTTTDVVEAAMGFGGGGAVPPMLASAGDRSR